MPGTLDPFYKLNISKHSAHAAETPPHSLRSPLFLPPAPRRPKLDIKASPSPSPGPAASSLHPKTPGRAEASPALQPWGQTLLLCLSWLCCCSSGPQWMVSAPPHPRAGTQHGGPCPAPQFLPPPAAHEEGSGGLGRDHGSDPALCPWALSAGQPRGRILRGFEAKPHLKPYMASLQLDGQHVCGGFLIARQWVLSAAHCMEGT